MRPILTKEPGIHTPQKQKRAFIGLLPIQPHGKIHRVVILLSIQVGIMTPILRFLAQLILLYEYIVVIRIVVSWFSLELSNPIIQWIARITDPLLDAMRRSFPILVGGGLDFSPILLFFLLEASRRVLFQITNLLS